MKDFRFLFEKYVLGNHGGYRTRYEAQVQKALKRLRGDLFVDIGAHKLFYSNRLSRRFRRVIAFEPNRNLKLRPRSNVTILRMALSDEAGQATFYCYNNLGSDGLMKDFDYRIPEGQKGPLGQVIDFFPVTVSTYDRVIGEIADLAKIDVEGAEFKVLEGMTRFPPRNLLVEVHDVRRWDELVERLSNMGYMKIWKVDPTHVMARV